MRSVIALLASAAVCLAADKVTVELYSEALCPGCKDYISQEVSPAIDGLSAIMDFTLVPYGNAHQTQNTDGTWSFQCQHGASECLGNMIESCAMHFHNASAEWFPFVLCLETSQQDPGSSAPGCAKNQGWTDYDSDILPCTTSNLGNQLQHNAGLDTDNLQPPHQFTPWVVMDGTALTEDQLDDTLVSLVCKAYTGPSPPAACSSYTKSPLQKCKADTKEDKEVVELAARY